MVAPNGQLKIELLLDDKQALSRLNTSLNKIETETKTTTQSMNANFAKLATQIVAVVAALEGFRQFMGAAIESAQEQEDAINRLNLALKNQGTFTANLTMIYQKFASELQQASRFGDEAILAVMQTLVTVGNVAPTEIKKVTQATLDFATAQKVDLNTAALLFAKAAAGNTEALGRYGIKLDETIPKQERFEAVLQQVGRTMGGAAQADVQTFSGAVQQLKNAWDDVVLEGIGNFIIKSPQLNQAIRTATELLNDFGVALNNIDENRAAQITNTLTAGFTGLGANIAQSAAQNPIQSFVDSMQSLSMGGFFTGGSSVFQQFFGGSTEEQEAVLSQIETTNEQVKALKEQQALEEADSKLLRQQTELEQFVLGEQAKVENARMIWQAYQDEDSAAKLAKAQQELEMFNFFNESRKKADESYWVAAGKLRDQFQAGMSKMFSDVIKGNFDAKEAFAQLGDQMLKTLTDYAAQLVVNKAISLLNISTVQAVSTASAAATAASWAPAAALVNAATFGGAATAGLSALAAIANFAKGIIGLEDGGTITRSGSVLVGESGPEILNLPRGASVAPLDHNGGGSTFNIHVEMNNPIISSDEIAEDFANKIAKHVSSFIDVEARR